MTVTGPLRSRTSIPQSSTILLPPPHCTSVYLKAGYGRLTFSPTTVFQDIRVYISCLIVLLASILAPFLPLVYQAIIASTSSTHIYIFPLASESKMAILKYRSLFADVLPRRTPKPEKYAPPAKPEAHVFLSASTSTSSLESITQPPAYSQAVGERPRRAVKVYPKPEADQVLSVTIRLRGDSYGEIFTTTATFQYVSLPRFLVFVLSWC